VWWEIRRASADDPSLTIGCRVRTAWQFRYSRV